MKIVDDLDQFESVLGNKSVGIAIGNFDGVHLGHQNFLSNARKDCIGNNISLVVITFCPHPRKVLGPQVKHFLINETNDRRNLLSQIGIEYLVEINFTRDFSTLLPEDFIEKYLLNKKIKVSKIYFGHDFAFGANKKGNFHFIEERYRDRLEIELQDAFHDEEMNISSTTIRKSLQEGRVEHANKLLGRPFFLSGLVIKSRGMGKKMGFPTANLELNSEIIVPSEGVYISETKYEGQIYRSVTNVGKNPTFDDVSKLSVETHLLDFDKDIYGETLKVSFLKKVRNEIKFSSVDELKKQIGLDIKESLNHFKYYGV